MRRHVATWILAVGVLLCGARCALVQSPSAPVANSAVRSSPQFQVIEQAQQRWLAKDWYGFNNCFTPRTTSASLRGQLVSFIAKNAAPPDNVYEMLARHSVTREQIEQIRALPESEKPGAVDKLMSQIGDHQAYAVDFLANMESFGLKPAPEGPYAGVPVELNTHGDISTIYLMSPKFSRQPVQLLRVDGEWKIDLPNG